MHRLRSFVVAFSVVLAPAAGCATAEEMDLTDDDAGPGGLGGFSFGAGGAPVGQGGTPPPGAGGTAPPGAGGAPPPGSGGALPPGAGGAAPPGSGGALPSAGGAAPGGAPAAGGAAGPCVPTTCAACLLATPCCKADGKCGCSVFGLPCG